MSDFRIVFVHGYTASSGADWYPNVSRKLDRLGIDCCVPDFPGGRYPHAHEWLSVLHREVKKSEKPLIFVGHSLGTRAVLLYLEKYKVAVEKVFLIAAFANKTENANRHDDGRSYEDFFEHEIDIETIKSLVDSFVVMHSRDDRSIEYEQGVELAQDLGAKMVTYENRDHFSAPENGSIVLEVLRRELDF